MAREKDLQDAWPFIRECVKGLNRQFLIFGVWLLIIKVLPPPFDYYIRLARIRYGFERHFR